ncbi:photosystem II reaction center protein Psb28 [Crocosphaera watsonii WH 8501]|uniref:Photosystem II reaction center Psb28 protein n=5 Tax=Crocosphaera watsonii TaxID=263511 RepID=Q4C1Y9_CROWT|nr:MULTISPECIES: photosystem II reaction center protein Psb28 [Crocosphaera]EAM50155.1 Photosystem II reaction centre W protein, PsbW [Crocosphaera watsonii WH 8501]EHJ12007.1 Photosystem II 13 kDa protein Psb28 (PsbW) [Crocosphaera watsonii WH 0003]MCH2244842.1 photosystem II reaction center protein Psb28 [Crocosphaera sp.]NQZ61443.1 photosystem II reaction center protein Psb28 [Crocosphaera sp.]CCQ51603.1 Photosystem II 13 kDa protein Psb28 (PsbW) [Crocosphaera watsonii WH 8502]
MSNVTPSIEFFVGISEELSNVSLRRSKQTGIRNVLMIFENLKSLERFRSYTNQTYGDLRLIDSEGEISVTPSSLKIIWGGDEGDELKEVRCGFDLEKDEHWDRFMRFMERYAEANGMAYQDTK